MCPKPEKDCTGCGIEQLGFLVDQNRVNQVVLEQYIAQRFVPGFIAIVLRKGKIVYQSCLGMMDLENGRSIQFDTLFQIQSLTKPIVCLAAMILYEQGKFRLDEPVAAFIPSFEGLKVLEKSPDGCYHSVSLQQPITFHHLFTHTSGLSYASQSSPAKAALHDSTGIAKPENTLQDRVEHLLQLPLEHQPASRWRYGFSHGVLAYLVELISGQPLDFFLRECLFEPLGMVDTGYYIKPEQSDRMAPVYCLDGVGRLNPYETLRSAGILNPKRPPLGSTGLISSVPDFLRLATMLLNRGELDGIRHLGVETVDLMTQNHLFPDLRPSFHIEGMAD